VTLPLTSDWEDAGGLLHGGEYAAATTTRGFSTHEHLDVRGICPSRDRGDDCIAEEKLSEAARVFLRVERTERCCIPRQSSVHQEGIFVRYLPN
jgi:hypothetical protein